MVSWKKNNFKELLIKWSNFLETQMNRKLVAFLGIWFVLGMAGFASSYREDIRFDTISDYDSEMVRLIENVKIENIL